MTSYDPPAWEYIIPPEHRKTAEESKAAWDAMGAAYRAKTVDPDKDGA